MRNIKKVLGSFALGCGVAFAGLSAVAVIKKPDSVYADSLEQQNPLSGKKVIFVEDENDGENADGVRGHLEAIGESDFSASTYDAFVKPALDKLLSFAGLVTLAPAFAGIALAIYMDDPGPVLFTQKRVGKDKQYFKLHKFRSMKMSTPHDVPTHMLEKPEQYITKVGKFIRAHSLDELPQIWDIFLGNMSFVGPRPALWNQDCLTALRDEYNANDVLPGLTGWAQINGRDELDLSCKARLDGEYVKRKSFWTDTFIFLKTLHVLGKDETIVEGGNKGVLMFAGCNADCRTDSELIGNIGFGEPVKVDFSARKKLLLTAKHSFVGSALSKYIKDNYADNIVAECISTRNEEWRMLDFSCYDVILHVAGIAHADIGNLNEDAKQRYYAVNTDISIELAKKAKAEGVKEFIFMSSMIVYGNSAPYGKSKIIDNTTLPKPANFYGDSKLQADVAIRGLADETFKVVVLRPPMIYGKGCKGNYPIMAKVAKKIPIFPKVKNERSMLYVGDLCELLCQISLLEHLSQNATVLLPQNAEWINTDEMVKAIAQANGKKHYEFGILAPAVAIAGRIPGAIGNLVNKAFGNCCYDKHVSSYEGIDYQKTSFMDSILKTELPE